MPAHESPLVRLERHARNRALEVAVTELRDGTWTSLTWNELYRRVIDGAAGMIEAGVNPGQVVVIRVATGARQLELELATRVAGAVPLLLPEHLDAQMYAGGIGKVGTRMGTGLAMAVDNTVNMVSLLRNMEQFFARESCGFCTPCRDGLPWSVKLLMALEKGEGREGDIDTLLGLVGFLGPGKTFCAHAPGAVEPLGSAIKYFRSEFEAGIAPTSAAVPPLAKPIVVGA